MKCRICFNETGNTPYRFREMMFGSREEFGYLECSNCGCVQIIDVPGSMSKYYPANYHSFTPISHPGTLRTWLTKVRDRYAVSDRGVLGKILTRYFPPNIALRSLPHLELDRSARVLDVGCGSGLLLNAMGNLGFTSLVGIDPFLPENTEYENGVKLLKRSIHEVAGEFDLIMFHHAFEHISDPEPTLKAVRELLAPRGSCIIRVPTVSSYAWEHYGPNWVQLDAPRHFYIHSARSLKILAERAGMEISGVVYDSSAFQFWASEQYALDIPLYDKRSYAVSPTNAIFTKQQIADFQKRAAELNHAERGDQAAFYLRTAS